MPSSMPCRESRSGTILTLIRCSAAVLGRALTGEEALHFAKTARRITEVLCMGPALDAAHAEAGECAVPWVDGKPADTNIA